MAPHQMARAHPASPYAEPLNVPDRRRSSSAGALAAGEDHFLADWGDPPGQPEQLVERTVRFLNQFAEDCKDPGGLPANTTFADILERWLPGSGDIWRRLDSDH